MIIRRRNSIAPIDSIGGEILTSDDLDTRIQKAGFNYTVKRAPAFYLADGKPKQADDRFAYYRSYDDANHPNQGDLENVLSGQFKPVQPREMMEFYNRIENELNLPLHRAGALGNGLFFAQADIPNKEGANEYETAGEPTKRFWTVASRNDGGMSTTIGPISFALWCANQMPAIAGAADVLRINHRSRIDWQEVRRHLNMHIEGLDAFDRIAELLHSIQVDDHYRAEFIHQIAAPKWNPQEQEKMPRTVRKLSESVLYSPGQDRRGSDTAWGLLNGTTYYVDHQRQARSEENRFAAAQWGPGAAIKRAAWDKLISDCVNRWHRGDDLLHAAGDSSYRPVVQKLLETA